MPSDDSAPRANPSAPSPPLSVCDIMSRQLVTVRMDDRLSHVKQLFLEHHFHHLLVVDQAKLVGVISDRDLFKATSPNIGTLSETDRDLASLNKRAHQIMSRNPITATTDMPIETAAKLLIEKNISCLPVVSAGNKLAGILSWKDILRSLLPFSRPVIRGQDKK